jgi:hypothetical protein
MHKTIRLASAAAAIAAAVALSASANAATTATGNANAEILSSLQLEEVTELDFGQIAVNGAGTVVVNASDSALDTCSANLVCAGSKARGVFKATGTGDVAITARVIEASVNLNGPSSSTMALSNFTIGWPNGNTLDATTGERNFQIGGRLTVAAGQTTGVYTGQYTVEVEYQ